jgi:hypothetical protein
VNINCVHRTPSATSAISRYPSSSSSGSHRTNQQLWHSGEPRHCGPSIAATGNTFNTLRAFILLCLRTRQLSGDVELVAAQLAWSGARWEGHCSYVKGTDLTTDGGYKRWFMWPFKAQWLLYLPSGIAFKNPTFCLYSLFMFFVWIWEKTAIISLYSIDWLDCSRVRKIAKSDY